MSIIKILEESQRKEFDKPPKLSYAQRKFIFALPQWAELEHKSMLDANKVGFTLQMGYFKLSGRFFKTETFYKEDILFIVRLLGLTGFDYSNFKDYYEFRVYPHRQIILINFGISGFGKKEKDFAYQEAIRLLKKR